MSLLVDVEDWVSEQFADATFDGVVAKLREEFAELEASGFRDPIEMADVIFVLCHLNYLVDPKGTWLGHTVAAKLAINKARTWAKNENGSYSHVEEAKDD